ncbi:hypothetical protein PE067_16125 [Paracoccus sp. DMF-8]|uniref:hypothetical protein n=1 Tax=Paracoccus sp. DMF-8 TaxID=3019445 RepID=UPI0023E37883|nr:hypothetical protein [Paracoccus sp. DMF-8]MDF3607535.1 hypothetical protein [Paracoccus sp. DMF-8]
MPRLDVDQFVERAAICEFDGGMSRFDAETAAAQEQGLARWQALQIIKGQADANGSGHPSRGGDTDPEVARQRGANDLPGVQQHPAQKDRSVSQHFAQAGWSGVVLLALLVQGWGIV